MPDGETNGHPEIRYRYSGLSGLQTRVELLSDGSGLKCVSCRRVYPVRDEIPVMLPEEAKITEE